MTTGIPPALRLALEDLHTEYCAALDDGQYEAWPELFTED
ncbi:MAG: nuclear transport factor 2 family protein, partial [Alphaproteobacteria bacterium]|nr:nuclear transport factor 2 family protein [Alphaproteobacteria bacterium]